MGKGLSKQKKPGAIPPVKGQLPLFGGKKGSIPTANRYVEKKVDVHGEEKLVIRVDHDQLETSHAAKAAKATLAAAEDNVCGCGSSFLRPSGLATHRRTCGLVRQLEYRGMDADEDAAALNRRNPHYGDFESEQTRSGRKVSEIEKVSPTSSLPVKASLHTLPLERGGGV